MIIKPNVNCRNIIIIKVVFRVALTSSDCSFLKQRRASSILVLSIATGVPLAVWNPVIKVCFLNKLVVEGSDFCKRSLIFNKPWNISRLNGSLRFYFAGFSLCSLWFRTYGGLCIPDHLCNLKQPYTNTLWSF